MKKITLNAEQARKCYKLAGWKDGGGTPETHRRVEMDWATFVERAEIDDVCVFAGRLVAKWPREHGSGDVYIDITDPDHPTRYVR